MKHFFARWGLWVIVAAGLLLRLWQLGTVPVILNRDEAALAYNALLLEQSGRDEWNRPWPITLESFGDYKLVGYPALLVPLFRVLGESDWVVRLPSAVAGVALIGIVFGLTRQWRWQKTTSLMAALCIAVSPVFVFYSRMAFEANVALCLLVASFWLLTSLFQKPHWWKYGALAVCYAGAILTYNTPLLLLPALLLWIAFFQHSAPRRARITAGAILVFVGIVGFWLAFSATAQKTGITLLSDETVWSQWTVFRAHLPAFWQPFIGNRYVYLAALILKNTTASFSPAFLVLRGGAHPWHSLPGTGHMGVVVYGLGLLGIAGSLLTIWRGRRSSTTWRAQGGLLFLLVASLAPSVVTVDAPHATRSLLFLVVFVLFSALGAQRLVAFFHKRKARWWLWALGGVVLIEGGWFVYRLFGLYPHQQTVFQPGFNQAITRVENTYPDRPVAVVDPHGYQYVLLAWYLRVPAKEYFATAIRQLPDPIGFRYGQQVTHYHFIAKPTDRAPTESVLVQWSAQEQAWQIEEIL